MRLLRNSEGDRKLAIKFLKKAGIIEKPGKPRSAITVEESCHTSSPNRRGESAGIGVPGEVGKVFARASTYY
jgi:hypothetical protein